MPIDLNKHEFELLNASAIAVKENEDTLKDLGFLI